MQEDETVAKQRLLEDWWQTAQHDLPGTVMLAYRRADVRDLNDAARTLLTRASRLGPDALEAGGREFRIGDRVLCRRNDERLGVRNGLRATVLAVERDALTLRTDDGAVRSLDRDYAAEQLEHGYALTGHAAQGATLERAFVLLHDQGALQEWGYVACTRARHETRLYLAAETPEREAHGRDPVEHDAPERLARALGLSAAEPLALEHARATARARALQRQRLEQLRADAARRLAGAEQTLGRLGWRGRRQHGDRLRAEIELQRRALRRADDQLAQLQLLPRLELASSDRRHDGPALERDAPGPERSVRRLPREGRSRSLEHGLGLSIDL
jgi:hypothetical protein